MAEILSIHPQGYVISPNRKVFLLEDTLWVVGWMDYKNDRNLYIQVLTLSNSNMPLREPRVELDRIEINNLLGWSGTSIASLCQFVRTIPEGSHIKMMNGVFVYNRGFVELEDTERRSKDCFMMSIWSDSIASSGAVCLFQQPVPVKLRLSM